MYRNIQILDNSFNVVLTERILPAIMICIPAIEIATLFVCFTLHQEIPIPGFLIFPIIAMSAGINNILIITLASKVYSASQRLLSLFEKTHQGRMSKFVRKELLACNVLKIKFGSNFIDNGTPVIMQNFCIDKTLSLILLRGKRF